MIIFEKLKFKNFLATGEQGIEIDLKNDPTVLVTGKNGAGKSTFLDALTFALFGKAFRKVKLSQLINTVNERECLTEVWFTINTKKYYIKRGIKPSPFEIWVDGELIPQDASVRDYQQVLEESILKLNYSSFKQIVILGAASFVPFMQLPLGQRREIIESLLDILVFSDMNEVLKNRITLLRENILNTRHEIDLKKNEYKLRSGHFTDSEAARKEKLSSLRARLKENEESGTEIVHKIDEIIETLQKLNGEVFDEKSKLIPIIDKLKKFKNQIEVNKRTVANRIKFYMENDHCAHCNQEIEGDHSTGEIEKYKKKLIQYEEGIEQLESQLEGKLAQQSGVANKEENIREMDIEKSKLSTILDSTADIILELEAEIKELDSNTVGAEAKKLIKVLKKDIKGLDKVLTGYLTATNYYTIISGMLKDTGIKTRIIKYYLPIINKTINGYLEKLNFPINFMFDENFNETIKSRFRDDFSYHSFSEGEKSRINLALLFAWREIAIAKNRNATNLIIFDEILDSSMDGQGMGDFMGIIEDICKKSNIFIISHREDSMESKFSKHIAFTKQGNFTVIQK